MGRIKTALVKRVTHDLIAQYREQFSDDFNKNKTVVSQYTNVQSRKIRNVIAGYITRLMKVPVK